MNFWNGWNQKNLLIKTTKLVFSHLYKNDHYSNDFGIIQKSGKYRKVIGIVVKVEKMKKYLIKFTKKIKNIAKQTTIKNMKILIRAWWEIEKGSWKDLPPRKWMPTSNEVSFRLTKQIWKLIDYTLKKVENKLSIKAVRYKKNIYNSQTYKILESFSIKWNWN